MVSKYWSRALLHDIIIIISNTGLRVDEMGDVRWKDIDWIDNKIQLFNAGKQRSNRELVMRGNYALKAIQRIKSRRLDYLKKHGGDFNELAKIQCFPNGQYINSLGRAFKKLMKGFDIPYDDNEKPHTLTSLRHTYATLRLKNDARIHSLAKQMGTSVRMIEKHYSHNTVNDDYNSLRGV